MDCQRSRLKSAPAAAPELIDVLEIQVRNDVLLNRAPATREWPALQARTSSAFTQVWRNLSVWYWYIDSASTRFRETTIDQRWDFLFPQQQTTLPGYEHWEPRFRDYVSLAYTTSVAFSPTDTPPLSRAAKLLTMTQSIIALIAITAGVDTAINILAGSP